MKKIVITSIFFLTVSLFSQNKKQTNLGSILGKVIDSKTKQPLPFVNIFCKSKKSGIVSGGISNDKGLFFVKNIALDSISINVQSIGYKTIIKKVVLTKGNKNINLGTLFLIEETTNLDEVVIQSETSMITQKIDRKVIRVDKDLASAGTNSLQMLENIPSVNVDYLSGTVSLRGSNARVLVDGKPSNLSIAELLKQIPSSSVKTVELITNPSAKYNPEGIGGFINIILKKNTTIGFNGSLSLGVQHSINSRPAASLDMNYRVGKINLYGNLSNDSGKYETHAFLDRTDKDLSQTIDYTDNRRTSNYIKVGVDYYVDKKNTFSFYTTQALADIDFSVDTKAIENSNLVFNALNLSVSKFKEQSYNADYKLDLDNEGGNVELEINYSKSANPQNDFNNELVDPSSNIYNYTNTIVNNNSILLFNLDYTKPIKEGNLELGFESRIEKTFNSILTNQEIETGGNPPTMPKGNTTFHYDREIYSAYINYSKEIEEISLQAGVRFEDFFVKGLFSNTEQTNIEPYSDTIFSIYPSAFLMYYLSETDEFQIGYSKRVDRPGIDQVTPIQEWTSPLTISIGNRTLRPQFTNSLEVNYSKRLKKGNITFGVFYRKTSDKIGRTINKDPLNPDRQLLSFVNYDSAKDYGVEFSSSYKLNKWWTIRPSSNLYVQDSEGLINNVRETIKNTFFTARVRNSFKASKKLRFQLSGSYRGRDESVQFKMKPLFLVNASARLSVLEGKGSLSLRGTDIFDGYKLNFSSTNPFPQTGYYTLENNSIYLGFSYNFGSGKNRERDRKYRENNETEGSGGVL
ncbi:MAG: TonB-dependent receptor domain-containing protein [Polaribacter sp.]